MAETAVTITDPQTGAQAPLNVGENQPQIAPGTDGKGVQVNDAPISAGLTEEAVPGLLHVPYDNDVTIQGYPDAVINQMTRQMGFREIKSMEFDYFSVDQRSSIFKTTAQATLTPPAGEKVFKGDASGSAVDKVVNIAVDSTANIHETDQIVFKGVPGYDAKGLSHKFYYLNGWVSKVYKSGSMRGTIDVVLTNANPATSENVSTITIPSGNTVIVLGHALAEEDSHVAPSGKLPTPKRQFMQKFMCSTSVTNIWLDSEKNCKWGLADIKDNLNREFLLEVEKTYWFSHKALFIDPESGKYIRTTSGLFEQLLEEGVEAIEMWEGELTDASVIKTMSKIFVGNRGSERRYMLTGMNFASALFSLDGMQKQVSVNNTRRQFTYDWNEWKLFNYTIQNKPFGLFDMIGMSNLAFVFDKAYLERNVFYSMDESQLDLDKLMIEDSKVMRCKEVSSVVLKNAPCHRILVMHAGTQTSNPDGALDNEEEYAL